MLASVFLTDEIIVCASSVTSLAAFIQYLQFAPVQIPYSIVIPIQFIQRAYVINYLHRLKTTNVSSYFYLHK